MRLLVLDIEGTLFRTDVRLPGTTIDSTIWQGIAKALGPDAVKAEVETHRRWESGEYGSYLDWMKETVEIHKTFKLSEALFKRLINGAEYNSGVTESFRRLDRLRFEPVLVSGGFRELATRAQVDLDIHHAFAACEYFFEDGGNLRSYNLLPCDFEGKIDFIRLMLREYGLSRDDWVFVGDGTNDVPVAKSAPISVGYRASPELKAIVSHCIVDFKELLPILDGIG
jgi:phosphoserine phosphatase